METNRIYNGDCIDVMEQMSDNGILVDIVLTSPPYNTARDLTSERARANHEGRYDEYSESKTNDEYDSFTVDLFNHFDKILKKDGVVLYNINYGTENPTQMWTCIADVCRKTEFTIADTIVWKKSSALPNNVSPNKLTRICEFVFVFCRKSEYATFKMNKVVSSHRQDTGQTVYGNVFNFIQAANNDGSNPLNKATFSTEFVCKLLDMYAKPNSLVYDPFMGTGTTAIGCIEYNHRFIGSELSPAQCEYAENRIRERLDNPTLF